MSRVDIEIALRDIWGKTPVDRPVDRPVTLEPFIAVFMTAAMPIVEKMAETAEREGHMAGFYEDYFHTGGEWEDVYEMIELEKKAWSIHLRDKQALK